MGKRKKSSRKPTGPKKREPLATTFKCVFCNHESSVTVKIDKKVGVGYLSCKSCGQTFQSSTNHLSHAVDIYSDWIDACDAVAKDQATASTIAAPAAARPRSTQQASRAGLAPGEKYTDEDDGFIDDDEADAEADYADE